MRIYVNELSFVGQAPDTESAVSILRDVLEVAEKTLFIRGNTPVKRHRDLKFRELIKEKTVQDVIFGDLFSNVRYRDLATLAIELLMKGPFIDSELAELPQDHEIVDEIGSHCEGSCYQAALFSPSGGAMISALTSGVQSRNFIKVICSIRGEVQIRNYENADSLVSDKWHYEVNPKHDIAEDKYVCGEYVTKMDLTPIEAQNTLTRGIKYKEGRIYASTRGKWYLFREHTRNHYHAFPAILNRDVVPREIITVLEAINNRNEGQIFLYWGESE